MTETNTTEVATLGGGCFWCLEAVFEQLDGVRRLQSGYSGGARPNPTYEQVCSGATGHAEVVQVEFDPDVISFREILEVFFTIHDPTTLNRQGADVGTQYRSVIFYPTPAQETVGEALIAELEAEGTFEEPVVPEIAALGEFYPAEDYHDAYYRRNASQPYCQVVITPKLAKLREKFASRIKSA